MKMIVLKAEDGYVNHAILAEDYHVRDGFVEARGNIRTVSAISHDIKGEGVALEQPTTRFEVPISNVALIVNL